MKRIKYYIIKFLILIIWIINYFVPKKNKQIIFYSSPDFTDNCRAIFEEAVNQGLHNKYSIIWAVKKPEKYSKLSLPATFVKHKSLRCIWLFMRSKYIFRTHSFFGNRYIKNRQIMVVAWHGMGIKGTGALEVPPQRIKRNHYDYLCVTSDFFRIVKSICLNSSLDRNVITGLPRNDFMFKNTDVLSAMGIPNGNIVKKIIWLPTFRNSNLRNDGKISSLGIEYKEGDLENLNAFLKEEDMLLLIKLHPWETGLIDKKTLSNIINIQDTDIPSQYSLYHLLGQMDVLLTDYSSIYTDFLLLDRPIGFVYSDFAEYRNTRGFIFEHVEEIMPGAHIHNFTELISFFKDISCNKDNFVSERERIRRLFHYYTDDQSSARMLQTIGIHSCRNDNNREARI